MIEIVFKGENISPETFSNKKLFPLLESYTNTLFEISKSNASLSAERADYAICKIENGSYKVTVADLSAKAASIGADLMRENGTFNKLIQENGQRLRDHLRTDTQIIAIALANNADVIYTEDKHFIALSQGKIQIKGLPTSVQ